MLSNQHVQVRAADAQRCKISDRNSLQRLEQGLIVGVNGTKFKAHNVNFLCKFSRLCNTMSTV